MILVGLLDRAASTADGYRFTIKGGVALEQRLRARAPHVRFTIDRGIVSPVCKFLTLAVPRRDGTGQAMADALSDGGGRLTSEIAAAIG